MRESRIEETKLVEEIRLFSRRDYLDSLTITSELAKSVFGLMNCIQVVTKDQAFAMKERDKRRETGDPKINSGRGVLGMFPSWFEPKVGHTIGQWVAAYLEGLLTERHLHLSHDNRYSIFHGKESGTIQELCFPLTEQLEKYGKLASFWSGLAASKKKA